MANNNINVELDWKTGRGPAAMIAKLEGFETVFFERELPKAAEDIALQIERDAKQLAPVGETGNLKAEITGEAEKLAAHAAKAIIKDDVPYAPFRNSGRIKWMLNHFCARQSRKTARTSKSASRRRLKTPSRSSRDP